MKLEDTFELLLRRNSKENFELLFNSIMIKKYGEVYANPKPQGMHGDGGNDGYIAKEGIYFQAYSPESHKSINAKEAGDKLVNDFQKLITKWENIQKYYFVINDALQGVPLEVYTKKDKIQKKYPNIEINVMDGMHLFEIFKELDEPKQKEIISNFDIFDAQIYEKNITDSIEYYKNTLIFPWSRESIAYRKVFPKLFIHPEFGDSKNGLTYSYDELLSLINKNFINYGSSRCRQNNASALYFLFF